MEGKKIYQAIVNVMGELGAIGKEKKNQQQGFMYRGVDDVMNALQPLLKKHGVFIVPEVLEHTREERSTKSGGTLIYSIMKIRHHFFAEDGSEVVSTTIGEGMDSADKSSNKAMAIAFKYACFQVFCIPTEGMDDPDGETPPNSNKKQPDGETPPSGNSNPIKITKKALCDKYGLPAFEKEIAIYERRLGNVPFEKWDEDTFEVVENDMKARKKKREEAERVKAGLAKIDDADIPFKMGE